MDPGHYRTVVRLADTSGSVSVFVSNSTNSVTVFSTSTFFLSWKSITVNELLVCKSATRVLMSGVWASNLTSLITFHLRSSWPAKMTIDHAVLIDADSANCHRTATFLPNVDAFHEIKIDFSCVSPSLLSFVSLQ
jgi:hypothetical protein